MNRINPVGNKGTRIGDGLGAPRGHGPHQGVDLFAPKGTPVYASADGCAPKDGGVKPDHGITGKSVTLDHGDGTFSNYYHLDSTCIKSGDCVKQGQQIGTVGTTGTTTSPPHLHYELRSGNPYGGGVIDPKSAAGGLQNTQFDAACGSTCGGGDSQQNYRPQAKANMTNTGQALTDSTATGAQQACNKVDTPQSVMLQQRTLPANDPTMIAYARILRAKTMPNGSALIAQMAQQMTGGGSGSIPPMSGFLTSRIGGSPNVSAIHDLSGLASSINNLVSFPSLATGMLRQFVQIIFGIPGIQGLEKLPYFNPLSESIGSSITTLTDASQLKNTDWVINAASGLNVTTPISKLNRHKIFPPVVESIDRVFQDLNHSVDLNLGQIFSQYAGFIGIFNSLLGLLPKEVTSILGPIIGVATQLLGPLGNGGQGASNVVGQAAGFVGQIFGAYSQLAKTAHGLDMVVDVVHHQRVANVQSQMLNKVTSKYGDQLRMLENHVPVRGMVQIGDSVVSSDIHGYTTATNLLGDKMIYNHYTNEVLSALKAVV